MSVRNLMAEIDAKIQADKIEIAALRREWHEARQSAWLESQNNEFIWAANAARDGECDYDYVEAASEWRMAVNRYSNFHSRAWRIADKLMGEFKEEPTGGCGCRGCEVWREYYLAQFRAGKWDEAPPLVYVSKEEAEAQAAEWKQEAEKEAERRWEAYREMREDRIARGL